MNLDLRPLVRTAVLAAVILCLPWGGRAAGEWPTRVELYLKIAAQASPRLSGCAEILGWWAAIKPAGRVDCSPMRGSVHTYRLRWTGEESPTLRAWLAEQKLEGALAWFEFRGQGLALQAATGSTLISDPPNYFATLLAAPGQDDDPPFVDETVLQLRNLLRIHPPLSPLVVAIIDSGVNFDAVPLRGLQWNHPREIAGNQIDDDANGYVDDDSGWDFVDDGSSDWVDDTVTPDRDPRDLLGHGTVVAAIVAATVGDDAAKVLRLMPLRVASGIGGVGRVSPFALAEAIRYATLSGAQIINLSVGSSEIYEVVREAIDAALANGTLVVASAGNTGAATLFPANMPGVLAVGALDTTGHTLASSARDDAVGVYLRGANMLEGLQVDPLSAAADGTSYAAPGASGRLAMMRSIVGDEASPQCETATRFLQQFRPSSGGARDWISASVNQIESAIGETPSRVQAWLGDKATCSTRITVAAMLRRAN